MGFVLGLVVFWVGSFFLRRYLFSVDSYNYKNYCKIYYLFENIYRVI